MKTFVRLRGRTCMVIVAMTTPMWRESNTLTVRENDTRLVVLYGVYVLPFLTVAAFVSKLLNIPIGQSWKRRIKNRICGLKIA